MTAFKPSVLIVEGRFYDDIADELLQGAVAALDEAGAAHDRITVPGALEIPQVAAIHIQAGLMPFGAANWRYHGVVALGCVIRGETSHYEIVAGESARALMSLATGNAVPVGNGILTVENRSQALKRASVTQGNKGAAAARACLMLIDVFMESHGNRSE